MATVSLGVLLCFLLVGCGAPAPVVHERNTAARTIDPALAALPEGHRVVAGDTLYSISFRYGLDWRRVASWNAIGAPYTIRSGQWLHLRPPPGWAEAPSRPASPPATASRQAPPRTPSTASRSQPSARPTESASQPPPAQPPASRPAVPEPRPASPPPAPSTAPAPTPSAAIGAAPSREVGGVRWRWPTDGSLVRAFNVNDARKGILLGGRSGQPVVAAADGEVVYSGNGLIGYGELVIIKHSERMLSAYAHNQQRLVAEGDRVRAGQPIARMGRNEDGRDVLHFEIRRDGKPEDPVRYLPAR